MITATIGNNSFILKSIEEAEALLKIMANADRIDDTYIDDDEENIKRVYYKPANSINLELKIIQDIELTPYETVIEEQKKRHERRAKLKTEQDAK